MDVKKLFAEVKFDDQGLVPAVVQEVVTKKVLMLAYMNREALEKTVAEGFVHYYSRSRRRLWKKGETSGNLQKLKGLYYDCDHDSLLVLVEQVGVACHTGSYSCFSNEIIPSADEQEEIIKVLYNLLVDRKENPQEGSYTNYLFREGVDKILKKVGEEAAEVIIGAKNNQGELIYEIADLIYHLMVLMVNEGVTVDQIKKELAARNRSK
jgi:phosphoribosyl-ATP pyrophosphohydrolase/phosphoribosyl-AMP cyclohydrolase